MKKVLMIAAPLILIAAVAMGVCNWQAMQKIQTLPAYSLKVIRDSIENHDAETFYKLVDVDKILNIAAEEILTAKINDGVDAMNYSTLELSNAYESQRQDFIDAAKIFLNQYLTTGKINFPAEPTEMQAWFKKSGLATCSIKNYSEPTIIDGVAIVKVYFHNAEMSSSFEVEIQLERISDTEWRVINAKGFEGYFLGYKRGLQLKLQTLNAPIQDKIAETFDVKKFSTEITDGDEYGFSKTLKISVDADFVPEKPVEKIAGRVMLDRRDGNKSYTPFSLRITDDTKGLQTFVIEKVLNPFVKADSDVMKRGLKKTHLKIEVTEIDYTDGTVLKEYEILPE